MPIPPPLLLTRCLRCVRTGIIRCHSHVRFLHGIAAADQRSLSGRVRHCVVSLQRQPARHRLRRHHCEGAALRQQRQQASTLMCGIADAELSATRTLILL